MRRALVTDQRKDFGIFLFQRTCRRTFWLGFTVRLQPIRGRMVLPWCIWPAAWLSGAVVSKVHPERTVLSRLRIELCLIIKARATPQKLRRRSWITVSATVGFG